MALLKRKRSGLGEAMDVVTRFVNACNRHDAEGVYACLHPDFDSIQPMYPSRNFRGADQVRRNWQAIFDAEPGFRLTVLRSAAADDTIWLELHGAGRDAEVAGVFVMGVQGDRIRWARIYSALVEPVPAGVVDEPAPGALREVPPYEEAGAPA
ncbi:MAG: nuclear transport factor 2 family protein, partial [Actinomycetota bacterium]|nr:nuclear transport factor 2 family protein [Actinomycetota bacterium]